LWHFDSQTGIFAPPVSFAVEGVQYVSVTAGWGGICPLLTGDQAYRHMIRISVRVSWPILAMVLIASSLVRLWPNPLSAWLRRNRKCLGLAFPAVMLWQILFIFCLMSTGTELFAPGMASVFITSDQIGYGLLLLMTLISFTHFRQDLKPKIWKRLHILSLYYITFIYFYSFLLGLYFSVNRDDQWNYGLLWLSVSAVISIRIIGKTSSVKINRRIV
jgi:hypothetical protein